MYRNQEVHFVALKERRLITELHNSFELRKDKKHVWLQKICFWLLGKLEAYRQEESIAFTRHAIEPKKFLDALFNQRLELDAVYNLRAHTLLIGAQDYEELMCSKEIYQMLSFNASTEVRWGRYGRGEIMGLKIVVIPWMKGTLLVPNLEAR